MIRILHRTDSSNVSYQFVYCCNNCIVSYWFVYCIILIWVSYCTDLYIISYRFANRIVPIHILYRTDSYIVLYQFFYRIIPIVLYFIDSYRIISYCTDSYHIVPNGWPQGPSKVGASFNRKLPSEKRELWKSSEDVATTEVDVQLRDGRHLALVIDHCTLCTLACPSKRLE